MARTLTGRVCGAANSPVWVAAAAALLGLGALACGSSADSAPAFEAAPEPAPAPAQSDPSQPSSLTGAGGGAAAPDLFGSTDPSDAESGPHACEATRAEAEVIGEPVDIIVLVDNSLSMIDEARSMEANLNVNFASILEQSGVDYRVILITKHRESDNLLGATSVCISSPLGASAQCPTPEPVFGSRFFHYSVPLGSNDSLTTLLDTYAGNRRDDYGLAPGGWSVWLRAGSKKVFLELSDDNSLLPAEAFLSSLTSAAPEQFGADAARPSLVWHSIVGVAEKATPAEAYQPGEPVEVRPCSGNLNSVFNAGTAYQDLSRLTGGLRFPICQVQSYDVVFRTIAEAVVSTTRIACGFAIPTPGGGRTVDLDKVAVSYAPGDGSPAHVLGQVTAPSACQRDAFLADASGITLCPEACDAIRTDARAAVDVLFTCESTVIVR
jgi:hypothetical protein